MNQRHVSKSGLPSYFFSQTPKDLTIRQLLLSAMTSAPSLFSTQIEEAVDELIKLKNPLINNILEIAGSLCSRGLLHIHWVDKIEQNLKNKEVAGYFDRNKGLIVLDRSCGLRFSEILIHELTHAVRYYVLMFKYEKSVNKHRQFCKEQFLNLIEQNFDQDQNFLLLQQELDAVKQQATVIFDRLKNERIESLQFYSVANEKKERVNNKFSFRSELKKNLGNALDAYEKSEQAEDFLPWFLQLFVRIAYQNEKVGFISYAAREIVHKLSDPDSFACKINQDYQRTILHEEKPFHCEEAVYQALLFSEFIQAVPIAENFVVGDFIDALECYMDSNGFNINLANVARLESNSTLYNVFCPHKAKIFNPDLKENQRKHDVHQMGKF